MMTSRKGPACSRCRYMEVVWPANPRATRGWCYCRHKRAAEYQARMIPGSVREPGFICKTAPGSEVPTMQRPTWCPRCPRRAHGYSIREFRALPLSERRAKIAELEDPVAREVLTAAFGHFGKRSWAQVALEVGGKNTQDGVLTIAKRALAKLPRKVEPVYPQIRGRL